ncbi:aminoglycoside phosphotransferase family protein [Ornithinimicrobium faecis]|uniref:aminoglycoside phosphotransferase family protein n=1 Tax=Ornithinimicrobium faecis TaxID=2934158 RepID=UPI0021189FB7|nr:aminoglycoside phosphotransferase family protein [Ornithinimicrobium sp. HY1745]
MITDEELVRAGTALDDRFGAERATAFGQALPGLVADLIDRWELDVREVLPSGATSVVLAVTDRTGIAGALKVSPDAKFLARQSTMLTHLAPTGRVPRVLHEDASAGAVLLEQVLPGETLDSSRATPPTPQEWADLLQDLHGTPTAGVTDLLRQRCEDMFRRIGARQALERVSAHIPRELWAHTVQECQSLLETDREQVVIHGDLHLGNVLRSQEHGLVVIDPKLCVGDRCFDLVDFVVTNGTADQMTARALELAPLVGIDAERVLRWCRVNAVVTAISRTTWTGPDEWTQTLLEFAQQR